MIKVCLTAILFSLTFPSYGVSPEVYRREIVREAHLWFGLSAPTPLFASQIHQESNWNPEARSKYARGLTQFTPETATWINSAYSTELKGYATYSPTWAIRAMILYDRRLNNSFPNSDPCNKWYFTLASYNGGLGWIKKEQVLAVKKGLDPNIWHDNVATVSSRAVWAFRENRDYPVKIIEQHQKIYRSWGQTVCGF